MGPVAVGSLAEGVGCHGERTETVFLVTRFLDAAREGKNLYSEAGRVLREACGMRAWRGLERGTSEEGSRWLPAVGMRLC